jgi:hypothetical protein
VDVSESALRCITSDANESGVTSFSAALPGDNEVKAPKTKRTMERGEIVAE